MIYSKELEKSQQKYSSNKKAIAKLKRRYTGKEIDEVYHRSHELVFSEIDCLECANCCKTTSPIILNKDIDRISKFLKIKPSNFTEKYLTLDEDGDYVFNAQPCPFLGEDNYCSIYEVRPRACRGYPHTNRKNMIKILPLTLRNSIICPAVARIFDKVVEKHNL